MRNPQKKKEKKDKGMEDERDIKKQRKANKEHFRKRRGWSTLVEVCSSINLYLMKTQLQSSLDKGELCREIKLLFPSKKTHRVA